MAKVVVDIDKGFRSIGRHLRKMIPGPNVTVGIQDAEAAENREGITNANLMAIHEFGSMDGRIPQRSVLRSTVDRERRLIGRMLERAVKNAAGNGNPRRELGRVGEKVRAEMVRTIDQSIGLEANAPSTIAAKGSSKPLIDLGILKNSFTWVYHSS